MVTSFEKEEVRIMKMSNFKSSSSSRQQLNHNNNYLSRSFDNYEDRAMLYTDRKQKLI
jgi:hypothetical protein